MEKRQLPIPLTPTERTWGIRYLLFQLVFLATLLSIVLYLIYPNYNSAQLNFAYFTVNFLAVLWIFRRFLRSSLMEISQRLSKILVFAALGYLAYWALNIAFSVVITILWPDHFNVNDAGIALATQDSFWLMAIGSVVLAPVAEELFYRALLFGTLHRRSRILAYTVSILVFCAIHVSGYVGYFPMPLLLVSFLQYIPGGLVLAWAYEKSGSIFCPILIHMAINAVGTFSMR